MSLKLCLMVCLILKLVSWSDIAFDMNTTMVSLKVWTWTFNWVWHEHCNGLFSIRNLVSSLILMFVRICLCDTILYTWFGKKWKRLKTFWGWKICLVYAHFFKHLSLSMPVSVNLLIFAIWCCQNKTNFLLVMWICMPRLRNFPRFSWKFLVRLMEKCFHQTANMDAYAYFVSLSFLYYFIFILFHLYQIQQNDKCFLHGFLSNEKYIWSIQAL